MNEDVYDKIKTNKFSKKSYVNNFDSFKIPVDKYNDKRRVVIRKII